MIKSGTFPEAARYYVDKIKTADADRNRLQNEIVELRRQLKEPRFAVVGITALDAVMAKVESESLTSLSPSDLAAIREEILQQIGRTYLLRDTQS